MRALLRNRILVRIMIVCIAEKPSVAKEIADILGAKNRRE